MKDIPKTNQQYSCNGNLYIYIYIYIFFFLFLSKSDARGVKQQHNDPSVIMLTIEGFINLPADAD